MYSFVNKHDGYGHDAITAASVLWQFGSGLVSGTRDTVAARVGEEEIQLSLSLVLG